MKHCTILSKGKRSRKERAAVRELQDVVNDLRLSTEFVPLVNMLRHDITDIDVEQHMKLIDSLPLVCPGMVIRQHRSGEETSSYNGIALLQISGLTNIEEVENVKRIVSMLPTTLLATTGTSGLSVKILVCGTLPNGSLPTEQDHIDSFHRQLYNLACTTYAAIIGRNIEKLDASPKDTFRWTFDPAPVFNPNAAPFKIPRESAIDSQTSVSEKSAPYGEGTASPENYVYWQRRFTQAMNKAWTELLPEGADPRTPIDQETYLSVTAREAYLLKIPVEEIIQIVTHHHEWHNLPKEKTRAIVEGVYEEISRQKPQQGKDTMQDVTYRLQKWIKTHYDLRYNELANGVEWRSNNSYGGSFKPLDSRVMNTMIQEANESGLEILDRDMKRYLGSTRIRDYNEAHAYLRKVGDDWDGKTDYIKMLAERVPTSDEKWVEWFHTWFLGLVAQWKGMNRNHANSVVPLLVGAQGCGKSTFGQMLLPLELRNVGYKELVDFSSKQETERMLTNSLLINLDEFNQIPEKTQQGFLKNLIQKTSVKGRRPYSSTIVNLPRYASFIATTNFGGTLADPSGSRRFIVVEITEGKHIDTATPVPYDKLYAQAQAELNEGRRYWFTPDEVHQLEQHNMRSEAQRPVVQYFLDYFQPASEEGPDTQRMRVSDILKEMHRLAGYKVGGNDPVFLGRWLRNEARAGRIVFKRSGGTVRYVVRKA